MVILAKIGFLSLGIKLNKVKQMKVLNNVHVISFHKYVFCELWKLFDQN